MTAGELIRKLADFDPGVEVVMEVEPFGHNRSFPITDVGWEFDGEEPRIVINDYHPHNYRKNA